MPLLSTFANAGARGYGLAGVGLATAPIIGTATATGTTTASVTYSAPLSDGGSPITSYTAVASPGGQTATVFQSGGGTINIGGLTAGTFYTFTVYATNALGNSPPSASSNQIRTLGVPDAPTIGTASLSGSTAANVSYTAPAYNGGSPITSYTAVSSPGGYTGTVSTSGSGSIFVSGLQPSTNYSFRVYATNAYGDSPYSGFSNTITTPGLLYISVSPTSFNLGPMTNGQTLYRTITISGTGGTGTFTVQEIARPTPWTAWVDGISSPVATKNFTLSGGQQVNVQLGLTYNGPAAPGLSRIDFAAVNSPQQSNIVISLNVP